MLHLPSAGPVFSSGQNNAVLMTGHAASLLWGAGGGGAGGGAGRRGVEWRGSEAEPGRLPGCWGVRLACVSLPQPPQRVCHILAIHYPPWLMHQSGKFDFFAEKGGSRGPWGEKGNGMRCPRTGLPGVSPVALTARAGGPLWRAWVRSHGAGGGRWAEVRILRSPCPPWSASPSALCWRRLHFPYSKPHL